MTRRYSRRVVIPTALVALGAMAGMAAASLGAFGSSSPPKAALAVGASNTAVTAPTSDQLPAELVKRLSTNGASEGSGAPDLRPANGLPTPIGQIALPGQLAGDSMVVTGRFQTRNGESCSIAYSVDAQGSEVGLLGGEGCLQPGQQVPDPDLAEVGGQQLDGTYVLAGTVSRRAKGLRVTINGIQRTLPVSGPVDATDSTRRVFMAVVPGTMSGDATIVS